MVENSVQSKQLLIRATLDGHISKGVWAYLTGYVGLVRSFLLPDFWLIIKNRPKIMSNQHPLSRGDFKYLITERIKNFWGYGNLNGSVWFVGMEEGYGEANESLEERFKATAGAQVFDIYDDLKIDPGHVFWFEEGAPTQSTYRRIIYLFLYLQNGIEPTLEEVRQFQIKSLGRKTSDHALLELMPLPSKSIRQQDWLYADFGIEGLSSRKEYLRTYKPQRVKELHSLIRNYKPRIVMFYSLTYMKDWASVTEVPLQELLPKKLYIAKDDNTMYVVVPHSTSFGISLADWRLIGQTLIGFDR